MLGAAWQAGRSWASWALVKLSFAAIAPPVHGRPFGRSRQVSPMMHSQLHLCYIHNALIKLRCEREAQFPTVPLCMTFCNANVCRVYHRYTVRAGALRYSFRKATRTQNGAAVRALYASKLLYFGRNLGIRKTPVKLVVASPTARNQYRPMTAHDVSLSGRNRVFARRLARKNLRAVRRAAAKACRSAGMLDVRPQARLPSCAKCHRKGQAEKRRA